MSVKFIKLLYVLFCLTFSNLDISSQELSKKDSLFLIDRADSLSNTASALFETNLDSASLLLIQALPIYKSARNWESYVETLSSISVIYYYTNDFEKLKIYAQKATDAAYSYLGEDHYRYSEALNNLAMVYQRLNDYKKSLKIHVQSIELHKKNNFSSLDLATKYLNLAVKYMLIDDYHKALTYQKKALEIHLDSLNSDAPLIGINYKSIGLSFKKLLEYDSTLVYLTKSLDILKKNQESPKAKLVNRHLIMTYHGLTELWLAKEDPQKANFYIQQALQLQNVSKPFRKDYSYELLTKIFKIKKDYDKAYEMISIAYELAKANFKNNSYSKIAKILSTTADILHIKGKTDSALVYTQKALQTLAPDYTLNDWANPPIDHLLAKSNALNILSRKASYLDEYYTAQKDTSLLFAAFDTYSVTIKLIRNQRQGGLSELSKNDLASRSIVIYENAIKSSLKLYDLTKREFYKEQALLFAENNKSLLLLETINEQLAKGNSTIPDSLIEHEKQLRSDLAFYQRKILEEKQKKENADQTKIITWQNNVFDFEQEYDILISSLEQKHPLYYQLKYENNPISINKIRSKLLFEKSALIEYFIGEEKIYLFCLTSKDLNVIQLETKDLSNQISKLRSFVSKPPQNGMSTSDIAELCNSSFHCYDQLLRPALESLPSDINELFIIPDGIISYVPFDILLTKPYNEGVINLPEISEYLVSKFNISYDYSATLLVKNSTRATAAYDSDFIAFAPSFEGNIATLRDCDGAQLSQLKCNQQEIENINAILNGQMNSGQDASSTNFMNSNNQNRITHLATHACVDKENPMLNKVYFSDNSLTLFDFYNTQLNTELVVLSACNTGTGKILKGDGVMSIAKGFMAAGSPSTMLSLWSVDDCSTSDMMGYYYKNLKAGQSKNKALQNAKLSYIESVPKAMKHPFYWGAFVQFGNVEAMGFSSRFNLKFWGILSLVLFGLGLILYLTKTKQFTLPS